MAGDELDELYWVEPDRFTALRTKLSSAAKQRGDTTAARRISANRKPTTAAWVVNRLALRHPETKQRLADLGDRLRAAHAAMDGELIRELSGEQRRLVDGLARRAFEAAGLKNPSAAVHDDVTATLQAAVADPDVTARLGRLAKAESWSGFADFGEAAPLVTVDRRDKKKAQQTAPPRAKDEAETERDKLRAAIAAAERARAEADDALSERQGELAAARLRHDQAFSRLREAERALAAAENAYDKAKQASRDAAKLVKEAKARLQRVRR
ncbi:MAG TPA: hypothetical protein VFA16_21800 [Mycobacterium sp.]|uniref:hypothetical protein n=1 Tax=Mycobacterium sp. TaxID=1785 RepID=UPI002D33915D|nr:hypothetical protein [Mycobacterium sp.]HZU49863.1 hypothetical protein [Mycobacterium sp.]